MTGNLRLRKSSVKYVNSLVVGVFIRRPSSERAINCTTTNLRHANRLQVTWFTEYFHFLFLIGVGIAVGIVLPLFFYPIHSRKEEQFDSDCHKIALPSNVEF